jgi:hypothetical protein
VELTALKAGRAEDRRRHRGPVRGGAAAATFDRQLTSAKIARPEMEQLPAR